jgi:potassium-dependent mechanosensitive channel
MPRSPGLARSPVLLVVALFAMVAPVGGQDTPTPTAPGAQEPADPMAVPNVFEVATRARIVADSAARAERTIERLGAVGAIAAEIDEAVQRHADLQALLGAIIDMEFVRLERLSRLRDQALLEDGRLETLHTRLIDRLTQLGELRGRWAGHQQNWVAWRVEHRRHPEYAAIEPDVELAIERIERVVTQASEAATQLLALQRRTEEIRGDIEQVGVVVTAIRTGRRRAMLERVEPILLSSEHRAQLADETWREWQPSAALQLAAYPAFVRANLGLLAFHALLAVVLGFLARWVARATSPGRAMAPGSKAGPDESEDEPDVGGDVAGGVGDDVGGDNDDAWGGLLAHPWALGVFGSVLLAMQRITLAPPMWDVLLWAAFGVIASLLSRRLFRARALRMTVYLLAGFYPGFLLLEVLQLPAPLFRLGLAAVAAAAVPVFLVLGRRRAALARFEESHDPRRIWPLRIGAAVWGLVLLAVLLGYDALGRWVLHATVTTAAMVFVVLLVFALARAALPMLLRGAETGRRLRGVGVQLAQRLIFVFRIAVVVVATLVLLDIWGLTESPVATWQWIISRGFQAGPLPVTVGGILLGVLVMYGALLLSGLSRTLVTADVERRQEGDRGLAESINRLVHYFILTVGVLAALAVLGVELQNFAIVAGALGIGVGFGLQNVVNNFASGLILLFERPVRVGDTVVVDDVWGTIQKIGLRSTVMVTFDQSEMIVPNADLVSEKVTNWTLSSPTARIILPVGVAYGSSISEVVGILVDSAFAHDAVLTEPPPEGLFIGFGDSSLDFELRVWVGNIRQRLQVRSVVLTEVERRLAEAGIEIPFPQRDLHLRSVDAEALGRLAPGQGAADGE